jgi:hypothetical protein
VRAAPAVSRAKCANKNAHEHTGSAEAVRPSLRNGFTAYNALSQVTGLVCHLRLRELPFANLMPASGHQDHTTSPSASALCVQQRLRVHRIPSRVDDVGQRPSPGKDAGSSASDLPDGTSGIFFARGLDRGVRKQPDGQIRCARNDCPTTQRRRAPAPSPSSRTPHIPLPRRCRRSGGRRRRRRYRA